MRSLKLNHEMHLAELRSLSVGRIEVGMDYLVATLIQSQLIAISNLVQKP